MILVDTSVLLDVLNDDPTWADRSEAALVAASSQGGIAIDDVIYAELSTRFQRIENLDAAIETMNLAHAPIPRPALFLAGKAFLRYRNRGGTRTGVLSDFFIGAHAATQDWPLLTRDAGQVGNYFPSVRLIAP